MYKENEGVRRTICDMSLLIFHLVLSGFIFEGVDIKMAEKILKYHLKRYPNGMQQLTCSFKQLSGRLPIPQVSSSSLAKVAFTSAGHNHYSPSPSIRKRCKCKINTVICTMYHIGRWR